MLSQWRELHQCTRSQYNPRSEAFNARGFNAGDIGGDRFAMIEVDRLSKRFGPVTAVDDLSFTVHPGRVTGFLGPNGAGKSTTMRVILGLDAATSGRALVAGQR